MKIAVISMIRDGWGGSEEIWFALARTALLQGDAVAHSYLDVVPQSVKKDALRQIGLVEFPRRGIVEPGLSVARRRCRKIQLFLRNIFHNPYKELFRWKPDVVIYNGTCFSVSEEIFLLKPLKHSGAALIYIGHYCGEELVPMHAIIRNRIKRFYNYASLVYTSSERSRSVAARQLQTNLDCVRVLRNPVNMSSTDVVPFPKSDCAQLAMVGNLRMKHKGQDIALQALSGIQWRDRNWTLNIYGSGEDETPLRAMVQALQLEERVKFHGLYSDIRDIWASNHLLLMPSRMEGMPLAVVEAMLCGRPSVLTDVGGHAEWVESGEEGWISTSVTTAGFEQALEAAWASRDQWEIMGEKAHQKARSLYDSDPGLTIYNAIKATLNP